MAKRVDRKTKIVLETYDLMFRASTPSITLDELIDKSNTYEDSNGNVVDCTDKLTNEEVLQRGWKRIIDFMAYYLDEATFQKIIQDQGKKYRLKKWERQALHIQMCMGFSPTSCKERWEEHRKEIEEKENKNE
jgi:hypothetical protein